MVNNLGIIKNNTGIMRKDVNIILTHDVGQLIKGIYHLNFSTNLPNFIFILPYMVAHSCTSLRAYLH